MAELCILEPCSEFGAAWLGGWAGLVGLRISWGWAGLGGLSLKRKLGSGNRKECPDGCPHARFYLYV